MRNQSESHQSESYRPELYLALVHHPIVNKRGDLVTTSVTNLDIHDLARSCRTFGFKRYFIVTPLERQHELVQKILDHWNSDEGNAYNPDRTQALSEIELVSDLETAIERITELESGRRPLVASTSAQFTSETISEESYVSTMIGEQQSGLLCLGTGWGLAPAALEKCDVKLNPIPSFAPDGYNHLAVRAAGAIYLHSLGFHRDRLVSAQLISEQMV